MCATHIHTTLVIHNPQVQQRERHLLHVLVERRAHTLMSHALGAWVVHVQHTKALRVARERLERATQRRLLARCFRGYVMDGWWGGWWGWGGTGGHGGPCCVLYYMSMHT